MERGGGAAGSGAIPAGALCPQLRVPSSSRASRPERRAAGGPSTGSGAPALPAQHGGIVTESNEPSSGNCTGHQPESRAPAHRKPSVRRRGGDMSTPQKVPPTRHYLQTTSDNDRYVHTLVTGLHGRCGTPERTICMRSGLRLEPGRGICSGRGICRSYGPPDYDGGDRAGSVVRQPGQGPGRG